MEGKGGATIVDRIPGQAANVRQRRRSLGPGLDWSGSALMIAVGSGECKRAPHRTVPSNKFGVWSLL